MKIYTERPKRGNAKKAWDKYLKKWKCAPKKVYYTPNYDNEVRGWICEHHYGGSSHYDFYSMDELF